jgi:tRNA pseudouridine38-40 synthase
MSRYKLLIEYDGSRYHGWQQNAGVKTIQGEIIKACQDIFNTSRIELYAAGRTDAGVHALGQVAHLDVPTQMPPDKITARLNELLPYDIHVLGAENCNDRFHARHDAIARGYVYVIARRRSAFAKPYVWWVKEDVSVALMQQSANILRGFHDFSSFGAPTPEEKSTKVNVIHLDITEEANMIFIHIVGSHFLWMMVRRMAGVLVNAGKGKITPGEIAGYLNNHSERPSQLSAPPSGLYLNRIYYKGDAMDYTFNVPVRI